MQNSLSVNAWINKIDVCLIFTEWIHGMTQVLFSPWQYMRLLIPPGLALIWDTCVSHVNLFQSLALSSFCINFHCIRLKHLSKTQIFTHLSPSNVIWCHKTQVNIGLGNGLLPDGNKPFLEPMSTYDTSVRSCIFIRRHYHKNWRYQSVKKDWKLYFQNCIQISQGPIP